MNHPEQKARRPRPAPRSYLLRVPLSPSERSLVERAARDANISVAEHVRNLIVEHARQSLRATAIDETTVRVARDQFVDTLEKGGHESPDVGVQLAALDQIAEVSRKGLALIEATRAELVRQRDGGAK